MTPASNLAPVLPSPEEMLARDSSSVPPVEELETLDRALDAIDSELSAISHLALDLRGKREQLLSRRAEMLLSRERAGLFEAGELIRFFDIEHVGPVEGNKGQ
jgi:hypothetical protein